jgi:Tol biopolymer transport system component
MNARPAILVRALLVVGVLLMTASSPNPGNGGFGPPERVTIVGYLGDTMEPFITRDGRYLLFNNRNDPPEKTDLFYAERIDGHTFRFRGPLTGANSPALDAVASVDCRGVMYFFSNRSYDRTLSTIYRARFRAGNVSGVQLVPGVSSRRPGAVNFDAEISPDGRTLYVVESQFDPATRQPAFARIEIYDRHGDRFARDAHSEEMMAAVNTERLQYAPSISADGRELFFTSPDDENGGAPTMFRSVRADDHSPFGPPTRLAAAAGFVEAPSLSIDGRSLYYHAMRGGHFVVERLTRSAAAAGPATTCARVMQRAAG